MNVFFFEHDRVCHATIINPNFLLEVSRAAWHNNHGALIDADVHNASSIESGSDCSLHDLHATVSVNVYCCKGLQ